MLARKRGAPREIKVSQLHRVPSSLLLESYVNRRKRVFTIDTSASSSIVRPGFLSGMKVNKKQNRMVIRTATGDMAAVHGEVDLDLQIRRLRFTHKVIMAEIIDNFILGLDVMEKYGFILDVGERVLKIGNEEFTLSTANDQFQKARRLTAQTVKIPARTEQILEAVLNIYLRANVERQSSSWRKKVGYLPKTQMSLRRSI